MKQLWLEARVLSVTYFVKWSAPGAWIVELKGLDVETTWHGMEWHGMPRLTE